MHSDQWCTGLRIYLILCPTAMLALQTVRAKTRHALWWLMLPGCLGEVLGVDIRWVECCFLCGPEYKLPQIDIIFTV